MLCLLTERLPTQTLYPNSVPKLSTPNSVPKLCTQTQYPNSVPKLSTQTLYPKLCTQTLYPNSVPQTLYPNSAFPIRPSSFSPKIYPILSTLSEMCHINIESEVLLVVAMRFLSAIQTKPCSVLHPLCVRLSVNTDRQTDRHRHTHKHRVSKQYHHIHTH